MNKYNHTPEREAQKEQFFTFVSIANELQAKAERQDLKFKVLRQVENALKEQL